MTQRYYLHPNAIKNIINADWDVSKLEEIYGNDVGDILSVLAPDPGRFADSPTFFISGYVPMDAVSENQAPTEDEILSYPEFETYDKDDIKKMLQDAIGAGHVLTTLTGKYDPYGVPKRKLVQVPVLDTATGLMYSSKSAIMEVFNCTSTNFDTLMDEQPGRFILNYIYAPQDFV